MRSAVGQLLVRAAAAVRVDDTGDLVATAFERKLGLVRMQ